MELVEFEALLSKEELTNFKRNFEKQWIHDPKVGFELFIKLNPKERIIGGAFTWADTPEDIDYWKVIQLRFLSDGTYFFDTLSVDDLMPFFKASEWTALTKKAFKVHGPVKYSQLMEARHKTIGLFIMAMLGLEHWRGVPHRYNDIISRRHLQRPMSGQFYKRVNKSVTA